MYNREEIIVKFNEQHEGLYDYSKVEYVNMHTKVCIICPKHGEFWQEPRSHINGQGCPKCGKIKKSTKKTYTNETFIKKCIAKYGDKYCYDDVNYVNSVTKVSITCSKHGDFLIRPDMFLQGHGCPKCKGERISQLKKSRSLLMDAGYQCSELLRFQKR